MKGFVFRLERLLELRSTAERERAQALGQAMRKEETQRQALEDASERLGSCGDQIAGVLDNVAPAGALTNLRLAIEAAMREVDSAALSHQAALDQMQQERELFSQARVERRVVERLREKRRATWTEEASRAEQSELDSVARNRRSNGGRSR
jgi:flagellar export protein FliJ